MKKGIYFYLLQNILSFTLIAMVFFPNTLFAQSFDETECPYFTVVTADTTGVAFPLLSTNVTATISGVIASVEMEQVYQNSGEAAIDATYIFPMSTNAAVYSMQMILDGRVIEAEIKEKAEAQQIFDDANEAGQTATLLDQQRPNVFQMSLANIQPGNVLQVLMKYTELIEPEKGIYQFVVPNIVGPRFTNGTEEWVFQSQNDSLSVANTAFNVDLTINAGMQLSAQCTSHNTTFTNNGETASCYLQTTPGADFIVDYTLEGNQIETGLLLYEGEEENFFLTMIQPPKSEVNYESPPREYVFIMDVSGSMRGEPIEVSKRMITNLLDDLNQNDRFNILFFAGGSSVFSPNSLPVTQANINNAITFIDNVNAGGSTQLLPAMQQALNMQGTENFSRTFVILTDGYVTVEKEAFELIRENLNDANFFAFGIGNSVNRYIIEGIAYVGEGESFVVTDVANAQATADTFKEYIEQPALTNIAAEFLGVDVYDVEPLNIPDVFAERPVVIYGKYNNTNNGTVTLTGDYANSPVTSTLNFANSLSNADENIAIKYLWARKRIQLLSDYGIASNQNDTLTIAEEVTQLGLQYGLVTEYTSFVAVDTAAVTGVNETTLPDYNYDSINLSPGFPGGGSPPPYGQNGAPPGPIGPPPAPPAVVDNTVVFTNYPWLSTITNPNNCNGETITVYNAGSYNFVLIQNGTEGKLYFENGTFYCNETPSYSCVAAYGLTNIERTWTCGNNQTPTTPITPAVNGCMDANATNYNASATADDGSCQYQTANTAVFATYPWLSTYASESNCNGETITVYDAGSYNFVLINKGSESKLYFENGTFYCNETPNYSCVAAYGLTNIAQTWTCGNSTPTPNPAPTIYGCIDANAINYNANATADDGSCQYQPTSTSVFTTYPWLSTYANETNCNGETITVYDAGSYNFILIESGNESKLYFENGTFYCDETPNYLCVAAYGLTNIAQTWTCGSSSPNPAPTISGCTDTNATNYNAQATADDGSCEYVNTGTCNSNTGTFFYQTCGGISYYFIRLDNGRVFDPYFADGIGFTPTEGQKIRFNYVINTNVTTPCTVSESPITITCFEEVRRNVFEEYAWLSTHVDRDNCGSDRVTVYDAGSYNFVYIQTATGNRLYYQDGTFYCADTPNYSCVSAYSLSTISNSWACGGFQTNKQADRYMGSVAKKISFNIYPNPASNKVFIDLPNSSIYQINLMDISGKVIKQMETTLNATTAELNVNDLAQGVYLIALKNETSSHLQKLVIK